MAHCSSPILLLFLVGLSFISDLLGQTQNYEDAEPGLDSGYNEVVHEEEDYGPRLDHTTPNWCHDPYLTNGEVTCYSPRGGNYRSTLGTRCQMTCDRGYRLIGRSSVQCMSSRRWSGTSHCRQIRCRVLPLIPHGTYRCSRGFQVDSRCDFTCKPGYRFEGEHSRTCLASGFWSGSEPICSDQEPPKIRCPNSRVKIADAGQLTARVTWDPPIATDTADKTLHVILVDQGPDTNFKEGVNIVRYKVYDQAKNRAACKFIVRVEVRRCPALKPPLHGYLRCSADGNNYGAECEYLCDKGYERRGAAFRVCELERLWTEEPATCIPMEFKIDVKTASALLDQFYEKRRLLILSAPNADDTEYKMQNVMLQKAECDLDLRHVTVVELFGSKGRIKERQLDIEVIDGLRQALRMSSTYFNMVLLDKQGADRERFHTPIGSDELFSHMDDYLLDEEERERLELHRNRCE